MRILVLLMTKYSHLGIGQRHRLEALLEAGLSKPAIAEQLNIDRSTVYREINRNAKRQSKGNVYKADFAQGLGSKRQELRPRYKKIGYAIGRRIIWLLKHAWSPEQIATVCKQRDIPMLSTEAIYLWLYECGREYLHLLRRHHRKRRKRRLDKQARSIIKNKTSIDQRPGVVERQERVGDLEADLMKCTNGYLLTITDRKSLFNFIRKIPDKSAASVERAMIDTLSPLKASIKTITTDNGTEFVNHQNIARELNVDWYFADPYSSWQRGCNENQNGLIRQFANRKTDLNLISDQTISQWQKQLNHRPRKKINFQKPIHFFNQHLNVALVT
jgi:IS30 family transposase